MSNEHRLDLDLDGIEKLTKAKLTQLEDSYQLDWKNGDFVRFHRDGDRLHFDYLLSVKGKHRLTQLVSTLPAFFRDRGITSFVTTRSGATDAMLKVGFVEDRGDLLHPIHEGCRMDEYVARKRSTAEPIGDPHG